MRSSLAALCSKFIENRDVVKSTFFWESNYMYPVCAAIAASSAASASSASSGGT